MTGTLGHAFGQLKQSALQVLSVIGEALAPTFKRLAGDIRANVGQIVRWVQANKDTIIQTLKVVAAITGIGVALVSLGAVVSALGMIIGGLSAQRCIRDGPARSTGTAGPTGRGKVCALERLSLCLEGTSRILTGQPAVDRRHLTYLNSYA